MTAADVAAKDAGPVGLCSEGSRRCLEAGNTRVARRNGGHGRDRVWAAGRNGGRDEGGQWGGGRSGGGSGGSRSVSRASIAHHASTPAYMYASIRAPTTCQDTFPKPFDFTSKPANKGTGQHQQDVQGQVHNDRLRHEPLVHPPAHQLTSSPAHRLTGPPAHRHQLTTCSSDVCSFPRFAGTSMATAPWPPSALAESSTALVGWLGLPPLTCVPVAVIAYMD